MGAVTINGLLANNPNCRGIGCNASAKLRRRSGEVGGNHAPLLPEAAVRPVADMRERQEVADAARSTYSEADPSHRERCKPFKRRR